MGAAQGLTLYAHQEEALLERLAGKHLVLATPTGSGKSLVATFLHFQAMCRGQISIYTCPIKALVNEKFFALCEDEGQIRGVPSPCPPPCFIAITPSRARRERTTFRRAGGT